MVRIPNEFRQSLSTNRYFSESRFGMVKCWSIQNIQCLIGSGGSWKYCCKYVGNIEKNNYYTVSLSADGSLIRRANVLHNTKRVTSDKFQQAEREKKRNWKNPQGTVISVNEVWHHILKYPEFINNMIFLWSKQLRWKQEPESHYKILTIRQATIVINSGGLRFSLKPPELM